jgi:uncharacterized membrane protein YkvA (DUF1232 family)
LNLSGDPARMAHEPRHNRLQDAAHKIRIEAHATWLAARDPQTPLFARLFGLFVAAYAFSPIDLIPDFIPVLGLLDDIILVPLGIWLFIRMVPPDIFARHKAAAELASERPVSRIGLALMAALWLGAILLLILLYREMWQSY